MKTIALLASLIILTQFNAVYAGSVQTGNSLLEQWHTYKRFEQNRNCADGIPTARFLGYVTSIADVLFNVPTGTAPSQLMDIVGRYLDSHPEERHEPGYVLVIRALSSVFPPRK